MILYPDQTIEQPENETVCFAAPIHECDWQQLYSQARYNVLETVAMRYVVITEDVYFMRNELEITDRVCVLLRRMEDQDSCIEAAAWVRIKENFPGMIYICRGSTTADLWQAYASVAGCEQHLVAMVDLDIPKTEE